MNLYAQRYNNTFEEFQLSPDMFTFSSIYLACVAIIGTVTNGAILIFLLCKKELQNPFNLVLANVILSEFIIACFGAPMDFAASYSHGWSMGESACEVTGFILTFAGMNSLYSLTGMAFLRWRSMNGNGSDSLTLTSTKSCCSKQSIIAVGILVIVWILSGAIAVPPLLQCCAPCWEDPECASYGWYILILGFVIPFCVLILSSVGVLILLKKNASSFAPSLTQSQRKRERRVTRILLLIILSFCIVWLPYALACLCRVFRLFEESTQRISAFSLLFAKSSVCLNPIIYIFLNPQFSNVFHEVMFWNTTDSLRGEPQVHPNRTPHCNRSRERKPVSRKQLSKRQEGIDERCDKRISLPLMSISSIHSKSAAGHFHSEGCAGPILRDLGVKQPAAVQSCVEMTTETR